MAATPSPSFHPLFMLFYSIELLLVHITCLHVFFVYIYLHLLAQDARLCHGRGKDHRILWTIVFRDHPQVAGPRTAREMVHRWADLLPTRTAIVCDSYFGSHLVANQMAQRQQPFLFLCKRDQEGVSLAGIVCDPPLQQKRMSKEASIASMSTKTQKWVANHHVWFISVKLCVRQ